MTSSLFLAPDEIEVLTGRRKSRSQIEALRQMGIQFFVNALNRPVVPVSAIEGKKPAPPPEPEKWYPAVLSR